MRRINPSQFLVLFFAISICIGTALLFLPVSGRGHSLSFIDALFTATSALCVTGLSVINIGSQLSLFGQIVLIVLIQIGGLGYMTLATLIVFFGTFNLKERLMVQESTQYFTLEDLRKFTKTVVITTFLIEGIGAVILSICFWKADVPWQSIYEGIFHSVSAFCNAGFSLFSDNLYHYRESPWVLITMALLIIIGGIGFVVLKELSKIQQHKKMTIHTKTVLLSTIFLIILGTLCIWFFEKDNTATLASLPWFHQWINALFAAVVPRTAGFSTISLHGASDVSIFIVIIFMFIGASPGGTGGGIKTTNAVIMGKTTWSYITGRKDVEILGGRISPEIIRKSFAIVTVSLFIVVVMTVALLATEHFPLKDVLFEVVSAFGTVGLSTGITSSLSGAGKIILCATMLIGRVGVLTIGIAAVKQLSGDNYRFPQVQIALG